MNNQRTKIIRIQRNELLANSDWTQLQDSQLTAEKKTEWAQYRQSLRDLPNQPMFPAKVTWPTKPE